MDSEDEIIKVVKVNRSKSLCPQDDQRDQIKKAQSMGQLFEQKSFSDFENDFDNEIPAEKKYPDPEIQPSRPIKERATSNLAIGQILENGFEITQQFKYYFKTKL
jgi:hypothetical protein